MIEHPMTALDRPTLIGYPPAPSNGGALEGAPPKVGDWVWQPKFDDRRVAIHVPTLTIWNQYGELSIANKEREKFAVALETLRTSAVTEWHEWLDAGLMEYRHDMMRGSIVIFDTMDVTKAHWNRRAGLKVAFEEAPMISELMKQQAQVRDQVLLVPEWKYVKEPLVLEGRLKAANAWVGRKFYEGLVAKREDAYYPLGMKAKQITPLWVKHRFDQ
jgi:hypothetical protein